MCFKNKNIMIVDDDKELLFELKELLSSEGFKTVTFSEGLSAIRAFEKAKPDLVLLDLKLKDINGFQMAEKIMDSPGKKKTPVLAMTGYYTNIEHLQLIKACGINVRLIKPFSKEKLIYEIRSVLSGAKEEIHD